MCAFERNWCDCPYGGDVVYGDRRIGFDEIVASGKYKVKPDAARIMCDNGNMGGDPVPGIPKQCFCAPKGMAETIKAEAEAEAKAAAIAKCGACGDCDYELTTGDIGGWGAREAGGSTRNVASAQDCAKLCSENDNCLSYEYSPTSKICNRNTKADPTGKNNHEDYLFCSNKAASGAEAKAEAEAAAAADAEALAIMQPGNIIALHNTELRRFVRMNGHNGRMDTSTPVSFDNLPANWEWEKFVVVDAGRGQIALHNTETNRFCRMSGSDMDSGNPTDVDKLNPKWAYEPFTVVSAWDGEIGLYNTHHKRFMRMEPGDMGISHDVAIGCALPRLKPLVGIQTQAGHDQG